MGGLLTAQRGSRPLLNRKQTTDLPQKRKAGGFWVMRRWVRVLCQWFRGGPLPVALWQLEQWRHCWRCLREWQQFPGELELEWRSPAY
jgi:hypothetical protein